MLMSRLRTDRHTHGNVKVEQYSAEAESVISEHGNDVNVVQAISDSRTKKSVGCGRSIILTVYY